MVGKWHLGHADRKYWPQNRGFDHFYGNLLVRWTISPRSAAESWTGNAMAVFLKEPGYHTTLIGNEAVKLIEQQDPSKPLFLYFASLAVHAPYQAPQAYKTPTRYPAGDSIGTLTRPWSAPWMIK